jgi:hypothetical protein
MPEGRMKEEKFQAVTERLIKRCNAWDERHLSSVGKERTLIKSVARTIQVYVMSIFILPGTVHEALTKCIRRF